MSLAISEHEQELILGLSQFENAVNQFHRKNFNAAE